MAMQRGVGTGLMGNQAVSEVGKGNGRSSCSLPFQMARIQNERVNPPTGKKPQPGVEKYSFLVKRFA